MSFFHEFIPKSYHTLRKGYSFSLFKKDLLAGITVGIIALPLAMAFAIASGVGPERGLFTAIIAGFLISALGGSRIQIGGPTGAFVVIVYGIIQRTGYEGLCISTLIGAVILILLGLCRVGSWMKYVPHPLIVGFTSGIALVIFSTQIKDFFGLQMGAQPADFMGKWLAYFEAFPTLDLPTTALAVGTLAIILGVRRFLPNFPWGISAIVLATVVSTMCGLPVATIESRFGEIASRLPWPSLPSFQIAPAQWKEVFLDGVVIAFLAGVESLLSAMVGDRMMGGRHRSNGELVAQGIANFGSVLFGGIPATGAIARTVANQKTGGQTPVAGMLHALVLCAILVFFSPIVSQIPLAALAAILVVVAWNMSEMGHFVYLLRKAPLGDRVILGTSFLLTVFVDLTAAISIGMVLASFLFMKQMGQTSKVVAVPGQRPQIAVYEMQGPLFFGAAHLLKDLLHYRLSMPKVLILRMSEVSMIDASGMDGLQEFIEQCHKKNVVLLLSGIRGKMEQKMTHFGLIQKIGEHKIFPNVEEALAKAEEIATPVS